MLRDSKGRVLRDSKKSPRYIVTRPLFRYNAVLTLSEKGRGRNDVGRGNQGKEIEQAIKTGEGEKALKPAGNITTFSGLDLDEDAMLSMFLHGLARSQEINQINRSDLSTS